MDSAAGYATGTVVHADALRAGKNAVVNLDVAFSGRRSRRSPLRPRSRTRFSAWSRTSTRRRPWGGGPRELGRLSDPKPLIGKLSKAEAPDSTELITSRVGPIHIPGIVYAELLTATFRGSSG